MKKLVLILAIGMFGFGCNRGPSNSKEEKMANKMADKVATACQLTPEQRLKVLPFMLKFIKAKIEDKDTYANDQVALRKADSISRATYIDSLKKILTPDQFLKLKAFHAAQKQNKPGGNGGDPDNGGQE